MNIFQAVRGKNYEAVEEILSTGNNINVKNKKHETLLFLAVENNDEKMVKLLIHRGADVNQLVTLCKVHLICFAAQNEKILEVLMSTGVNLDYDANGETLLHFAVRQHSIPMISLLCKYGFDINKRASNGMTAIMFAAMFNHVEAFNLLLGQGAITDEVLLIGIQYRSFACIESLFASGYVCNNDEIHNAIISENSELIELVFKYATIDHEFRDKDFDRSFLETAISKNLEHVLDILLETPLDPTHQTFVKAVEFSKNWNAKSCLDVLNEYHAK